jgi:hypothetical protein
MNIVEDIRNTDTHMHTIRAMGVYRLPHAQVYSIYSIISFRACDSAMKSSSSSCTRQAPASD